MNIAVTSGDPAGIGPDISLALARRAFKSSITILGDKDLLEQRAAQLGLDISIERHGADYRIKSSDAQRVTIRHIPVEAPVTAGVGDARNAKHILKQIDAAAAGCSNGQFDAMTTCPVSKSIICQSGIAFSGHTEYIAQMANCAPVMMLTMEPGFRVALVTTHLPLREVADAITPARLKQTFHIVNDGLKKICSIANPRIGVCGLNPHAGEQGQLGTEDEAVIRPSIDIAKRQGIDVTGPLPADTVFNPEQLRQFDIVVAMFHDQGLPAIKYAGFGRVVNVTLGLPFIRTSVDHGTAFELAGSGKARGDSLVAAVRWAIQYADA